EFCDNAFALPPGQAAHPGRLHRRTMPRSVHRADGSPRLAAGGAAVLDAGRVHSVAVGSDLPVGLGGRAVVLARRADRECPPVKASAPHRAFPATASPPSRPLDAGAPSSLELCTDVGYGELPRRTWQCPRRPRPTRWSSSKRSSNATGATAPSGSF